MAAAAVAVAAVAVAVAAAAAAVVAAAAAAAARPIRGALTMPQAALLGGRGQSVRGPWQLPVLQPPCRVGAFTAGVGVGAALLR